MKFDTEKFITEANAWLDKFREEAKDEENRDGLYHAFRYADDPVTFSQEVYDLPGDIGGSILIEMWGDKEDDTIGWEIAPELDGDYMPSGYGGYLADPVTKEHVDTALSEMADMVRGVEYEIAREEVGYCQQWPDNYHPSYGEIWELDQAEFEQWKKTGVLDPSVTEQLVREIVRGNRT